MIAVRNASEIALLRQSGAILATAKAAVLAAVKPGITTSELDRIAYDIITKHGAIPAFKGYNNFPATICASINEEMIHGLPSSRKLVAGDLLKIDTGAVWKGYYSDSAFTCGVGNIGIGDVKLIEVARGAFLAGLKAIVPGARLGDVEHAIGAFVASHGMYVPTSYAGHGIGTALHEEPFVHNSGTPHTGPLLKDGMVLAIEPMILQGSPKTKVLADKWTVVAADGRRTAHYEHTVLIQNGHGEILTGEF